MSPKIPASRAEAEALDRADPLAARRSHFRIPEGITYLVGHSLGPATEAALARTRQVAEDEWARGLVRSWNSAGWIDLAARVGDRIAPLIGAPAGEVLVCDSVSVNLFKLAAAALPLAARRRIIVDDDDFPTDRYIAEGLAGLVGADCVMSPPERGVGAVAEGGVLIKSLVHFRSGMVVDMALYEREARRRGSLVVWDLSHAAGIVPVDLAANGARLAAGCTYKYLNGGPGAPAYVFANADIAPRLQTPLPGWLGHAEPFAFAAEYRPASGVGRFTVGTPGILSLAALDGALDAFEGIRPEDLAAKARALGGLCLARAAALGVETRSPSEAAHRGGHVSLAHPEGYAIVRALEERGILADFRTPDTIRFGLSPLFLGYREIWDAMDALGDILAKRAWDRPEFRIRAKVT